MIKTLISIDLTNLNYQVTAKNKRTNILTLRDYLTDDLPKPCDIYFYISYIDDYDYPHAFIDFLLTNGFYVVTKQGKVTSDGVSKTNVDIDLALDAYELCTTIKPDYYMLVSGDSDFSSLADRLRRKGIYVLVASTKEALGKTLRNQCNEWLDLQPWIDTLVQG